MEETKCMISMSMSPPRAGGVQGLQILSPMTPPCYHVNQRPVHELITHPTVLSPCQ